MASNMSDEATGVVAGVIRWAQNSVAAMRAAVASRAGVQYEGFRDTWKILGYKLEPKYDDYLVMYERQDVAGRIVEMPCQETWRNHPKLVSIKDPEGMADDEFFDDFEALMERVRGWHWLEKVDTISGIGRYGVLFIGVRDGSGDLQKPVSPGEGLNPEDILYLAAYPEGQVEIKKIDMDPQSVRFGLPEEYEITLVDFQDANGRRKTGGRRQGISQDGSTVKKLVHHSRIIHVAENTTSDRIHGRPRLQRVFNCMFDLLKVSGGSAEMFWQNVAQIFHVNLDPELEYDDADLTDLDEKLREMLQGLRRIVQTEGIEEIKTLQGATPDPRGVFSVLRALISSSGEIPQRILFGSEQGEMASTQDKSEWYGRIEARRDRHVEPNLFNPFVMRLVEWGVLTLPEGGVTPQWPSLFEETPQQKAQNARALSMAAQKLDAKRPYAIIGRAEIREAAGLPRRIPSDVQKDIEDEDKRIKEEAEKMRKEMETAMGSGDEEGDEEGGKASLQLDVASGA